MKKQKGFTSTPKFFGVSSRSERGFTLVEIIVVMALIGILASIVFMSLVPAREKARDSRRKAEVSQIGRFLAASCYVPDAGVGEYDLSELLDEARAKFPDFSGQTPLDPRIGTDVESFYKYIVTEDGDCALYANLENEDERVTLTLLSEPTAGGGTGVLRASSDGWNGTPIYFQISN